MKIIKISLFFFLIYSCSATRIEKSDENIFKASESFSILSTDYWNSKKLQIISAHDKNFEEFENLKNEWKLFYKTEKQKKSLSKEKITKDDLLKTLSIYKPALRNYINDNIHAFVIVKDLGHSQFIYKTKANKYIVFIDQDINAVGLNDWYLQREQQALSIKDTSIKMNTLLSYANDKNDTLIFIFAQTISLILAESLKDSDPYYLLSWEHSISKWNRYFSEISFVSYYGQSLKSLNFDKTYEFYQLLEKTDFINLYSTSSPQRDFIETSSIYIYNILFARAFHIEFYQENVMLDSFSSCLKNARCLNKRLYFDRLFNSLK